MTLHAARHTWTLIAISTNYDKVQWTGVVAGLWFLP